MHVHWSQCPRCHQTKSQAQQAVRARLEAAYGNVPLQEYMRLVRQSYSPINWETTMREEYLICTNANGRFAVIYRCHCKACDFQYEYHHSADVALDLESSREP